MLGYNLICLYFLGMMVACIFGAARIRALNGAGYARAVMLLCTAVCFYIFGYTMELNAASPEQLRFWNGMEYIGIPYVSALWLMVVLLYTGHFTRCKKLLLAVIFGIPVITMLLRFTNPLFHLYFSSLQFVEKYGKLFLFKQPGPWMYVQMVHSMMMLLTALGLLLYDSAQMKVSEPGKTGLIAAATVFAAAGLICSWLKPFAVPIDFMALFLPVTSLLVLICIYRYDFLESRSMARSRVFEESRDAILLINSQNKIVDYNARAKRLFGEQGIALTSGYISHLFSNRPKLEKSIGSDKTSVLQLPGVSGNQYFEISTKKISSRSMSHGWIKTIRDITNIYELNETLKHQAMFDDLSGLRNRRAFMLAGKNLILRCRQNDSAVYLIMLDLDHFKRVNDQFGHQMGDQVIANFGKMLRETFDGETLTARLGGEEFCALIPDGSDAEIRGKADALLQKTDRYRYVDQGRPFHVTVSIGIAKKTEPFQTLEDLLHRADQALYISKDSGRNRITVL